MNRAVFLDRDGVLNRAIVREGKPYAPATTEEVEMLPGVPEAIFALKAAGYRTIVVTNQPDVGRGDIQQSTAEAINAQIKLESGVDEIRIPSERAFRSRERALRDGLEIDRLVFDALVALAARLS